MNNTVSTGIDKLKNEKPIEALYFLDNTCPKCDDKLELVTRKLDNISIAIRYECNNCGYICPIKYDMKDSICNKDEFNMPKYSPLYDRSIYEFIKYFGE